MIHSQATYLRPINSLRSLAAEIDKESKLPIRLVIDGEYYWVFGRKAANNLGEKLRYKDMFENNIKLCADIYADCDSVAKQRSKDLSDCLVRNELRKSMMNRAVDQLVEAEEENYDLSRKSRKRVSIGLNMGYSLTRLKLLPYTAIETSPTVGISLNYRLIRL